MRLNCALVSSFLFVSAVLADFHSEKQLEPLFLQPAEKFINGTLHVRAPGTYGLWAGGVVERNRGTVTLATGTFFVPNQGAPGSGLVIAVGIDGLTCETAFLAAGVNVMITDHGVNVIPWGQFSPRIIQWNPDPPYGLIISAGDKLRITVQMTFSSTEGFFSIENLTTDKSWSDSLTNNPDSPLCQQNAFWVISAVPGGQTPLANFGALTFTNLLLRAPGTNVLPRNPTIINIEQNNQVMTSVQIQPSSDITITYG